MTETLFAFSAFDVYRLRQLLAAFEQGRLNREPFSPQIPPTKGQDTHLGHITASVPAMSGSNPGLGTGVLLSAVDITASPPTVSDVTGLDGPITVENLTENPIGPGYYALCRDPSSGYFIPCPIGGNDRKSISTTVQNLTTSWANNVGLTLPANTTWLLIAQINAEIVSSSTGAGDSISCRLYDGSAVVGCPIQFCMAVCDNLTDIGAGYLMATYTAGSSGATVNVQGIVNTSSGSTGSILACGSLAGGQLVGVRLS